MAKKPEKKKAKKTTTEKSGRRYAGKLKAAAEKPAPPKIELAETRPIELEKTPQRTQERFAQRIESPEIGRRMMRRLAVNPDASIADMSRWQIREEIENERFQRRETEVARRAERAGVLPSGYRGQTEAVLKEVEPKISREKEVSGRSKERQKEYGRFLTGRTSVQRMEEARKSGAFEKAVGVAGAGGKEPITAKILMELRTATKPHEGRGALNRLKQEVRREAGRIEPGVLQKLGVKSRDLARAATSQQARAKILETLKKVPLKATGTGILKYGAALILLEAGAKYLYGLGKTAKQLYSGEEVKPLWENTPGTLLGSALSPRGRSAQPEASPAAAPAASIDPREQMLRAFGQSDPMTQQVGLDAAQRNVELADRVYPALGQAQGEAAGLPALLAAQRMRAYSMLSDGEVPIVQGELGAAVSQQVNQRQAESDAYLRQLRAAFSGVGR